MNLQISDAREEFLPRLNKLEQQCFSTPWTAEQLRSQFPDAQHEFLCALDEGGKVRGYVGMLCVLDEGYIGNVAVDPAFRRRGIADCLLDALEARARTRRLSFVTLEVRAGNAPAIALYAKHGFQRVGLRKAYYTQPKEDAVLMTKTLENEAETL